MKRLLLYPTVIIVGCLFYACASLPPNEFSKQKYFNFPKSKYTAQQMESEKILPTQHHRQYSITTNSPELKKNESEDNSFHRTSNTNDIDRLAIHTNTSKSYMNKERRTHFIYIHMPSSYINPTNHKTLALKRDSDTNIPPIAEKSSDPVMLVLLALLALIVPPVAIYIHEREANKWFWLSLLLWLFAFLILGFGQGAGWVLWFGAIIVALLVVFDIV